MPSPTKLRTRPIQMTMLANCTLCHARGEMHHWDGDLLGPVCPPCVEPLRVAEIEMLAAGLTQPENYDER